MVPDCDDVVYKNSTQPIIIFRAGDRFRKNIAYVGGSWATALSRMEKTITIKINLTLHQGSLDYLVLENQHINTKTLKVHISVYAEMCKKKKNKIRADPFLHSLGPI